jgi:hypothetical protein
MKTSKYLVCNDILAKEGEPSEFILHSYHPRFLAKVEAIDFEELDNQPEKPFADVLYINEQGKMDIYRLEVCQYFEKADEDDILDELFPARDYFTQYLQELEKEEGGKPGFPVKDFSSELPGLKILQGHETWTVIYNGVVAEFDSEDNMNEFLEHDLDIEPDLLDQGIINQFD